MSWRIIVISKRAKLDLQLGTLVVRSDEITKIVLSEISMIIIESTAVSLTTSLIAELSKRKIKVVFCDEKRNPSCELIGYYGSHDTSNKVRKQIAWKENTKEVMYEKTAELTRYIAEYIMNLEDSANYTVQFSEKLDVAVLLKAMDVKYEEIEESLLEHLARYIKLVVDLLGVRLLVFVNIRSYLNDDQFAALIQEIEYQEIKALFIENQEKGCVEGGMRYIIDKDGCEIY